MSHVALTIVTIAPLVCPGIPHRDSERSVVVDALSDPRRVPWRAAMITRARGILARSACARNSCRRARTSRASLAPQGGVADELRRSRPASRTSRDPSRKRRSPGKAPTWNFVEGVEVAGDKRTARTVVRTLSWAVALWAPSRSVTANGAEVEPMRAGARTDPNLVRV